MWAKWGAGQRQNLVVWGGTHKEQEGQSGGQGAEPRKLHEARGPPAGHPQDGAPGIKVGPYSLAVNPSCVAPAPRGILGALHPMISPRSLNLPANRRPHSITRREKWPERQSHAEDPSFNPARSDLTPSKSWLGQPAAPGAAGPPQLPAMPPGTAAPSPAPLLWDLPGCLAGGPPH